MAVWMKFYQKTVVNSLFQNPFLEWSCLWADCSCFSFSTIIRSSKNCVPLFDCHCNQIKLYTHNQIQNTEKEQRIEVHRTQRLILCETQHGLNWIQKGNNKRIIPSVWKWAQRINVEANQRNSHTTKKTKFQSEEDGIIDYKAK